MWLKLPVVAAVTVLVIIVSGLVFTLPPGPLCDEGMVWFMEGGCDWGGSNIFFFGKLGLVLVTNVVALTVGLSPARPRTAFLPHVGALVLIAITLLPGTDDCVEYYGHPNGNYSQLLIEQAAFALLIVASFGVVWRWPKVWRVAGIAGLNLIHVALFYVWCEVMPHWTWLHTTLLSGSLFLLALVFGTRGAARARRHEGGAQDAAHRAVAERPGTARSVGCCRGARRHELGKTPVRSQFRAHDPGCRG